MVDLSFINFGIVAAALDLIAASLHIVAIVLGAPGYRRFFRHGEKMANVAESDQWYPITVTGVKALVLALCALFALSGAGIIPSLPFINLILLGIAFVFAIQFWRSYRSKVYAEGTMELADFFKEEEEEAPFWCFWNSRISLYYAFAHFGVYGQAMEKWMN